MTAQPADYAPRILSWNLTNQCNLRCAHGYLDAAETGAAELSTEEALGVVDQIARAGTEMLILSGGEPLMRKEATSRLRSVRAPTPHFWVGNWCRRLPLRLSRRFHPSTSLRAVGG